MSRPELRVLATIAAVALALRLTSALLWAPEPTGDAVDYLRLAEGLARGEGFRNEGGGLSSWRPPLYPAFLAAFVSSSPAGEPAVSLGAVRMVQALLSTASVVLLYGVARPLLGRGVAGVAALLTAIGFAHIAAVSRVLSETLCVALLLAAMAILARSRGVSDTGRSRDPEGGGGEMVWRPVPYLLSGCLLGAAALVRSMLVPFPFVVAAGLASTPAFGSGPRDRRPAVASGLLVLTGAALVLAPWTVRNYAVHGKLIPVSTQGGATLYAGNHPRDGYVFGVMADDARTRAASTLSEPSASRYLVRKTVEDLTSTPGAVPRLALLKLLYFWTPEDWELLPGEGRFNHSYAFVALWAALGLALSGLPPRKAGRRARCSSEGPVARRRLGPAQAWLVWLPLSYFVAVALVFYGSPRLRMPVEPFLAILAAWSLCRFRVRWGGPKTALAVGVTSLAVVGTGAAWLAVTGAVKSALATAGAI